MDCFPKPKALTDRNWAEPLWPNEAFGRAAMQILAIRAIENKSRYHNPKVPLHVSVPKQSIDGNANARLGESFLSGLINGADVG